MLTLATRAFPQLPDVHAQAIPRLCYGAEDREAGLYTLDGQPKTMEEAVDHMQYFQHSRQSRPPKPKREAVRAMADKDKVAEDSQKDGEGENEIKELKSRLQQLENALRESSIAQADPMSPSPPPPPQGGPVAPRASQCFKCGEVGHFRRECPTNVGRRTEAGAGAGGDRPPQYRGGHREDMGRGGSRYSGRGGRDNQPPRNVRTLTPDRDVGLERQRTDDSQEDLQSVKPEFGQSGETPRSCL